MCRPTYNQLPVKSVWIRIPFWAPVYVAVQSTDLKPIGTFLKRYLLVLKRRYQDIRHTTGLRMHYDRVDDIVVTGNRDAIFGAPLEVFMLPSLRSHGSRQECRVPLTGHNGDFQDFSFEGNLRLLEKVQVYR